jgi:hypothetical protein
LSSFSPFNWAGSEKTLLGKSCDLITDLAPWAFRSANSLTFAMSAALVKNVCEEGAYTFLLPTPGPITPAVDEENDSIYLKTERAER